MMKMILTIASREFRSLFLSPLAWSILAVLQFVLAYLFITEIEAYNALQPRLASLNDAPGLTDLVVAPLYSNAGIFLLLLTPLLTMRIICQERRNQTLALLLSAPVTSSEIILGKYSAILGFLLMITLLISGMPLTLLLGGSLDFGKYLANILALLLVLASFASIGLYMSSIASHPTVAAISSFAVLLLLWIMDVTTGQYNQNTEVLQYLSILEHFQSLQSGFISSTDICYFLLFTATFLILSIRQLENERLQK